VTYALEIMKVFAYMALLFQNFLSCCWYSEDSFWAGRSTEGRSTMVMNDSFLDSVVATMRVEKIKVMDFLNMSRFHGILMMKHIIANRHE